MEVLDSGSFDAYQIQPNTRTTRAPYTNGQLSLECLPPEVPSLSSTKDATLIKVTTTGDHEQQTASSEDKLRGMVAEMNQTLKELSGSAIDANVDPNTNQAAGKGSIPEIKDPALLKAISKMKKLDGKLADVTKRERKVKRQRKKLEQLLDDGVEPSSALALVQNEEDSDQEDSYPSSPVFPTELRDTKKPTQVTVEENAPLEQLKEVGTSTSQNPSSKKNLTKTGQDFIKRNIELVQDAGSLVAMTEEEKKRLEFLLEDETVEDIEEINKTACRDLVLPTKTAFLPDTNSLERLRVIDSRLEELMPADDWRSIRSNTPLSSHETYHLDLKEAVKTFHCEETSEDSEQLGESALKEIKHSRGEQQRLREIDVKLKHLETSTDDDDNPPSLSADQLEELLQQCYKEQGIELTSNENSLLNLDQDEINDSQ